MSSISDGELIVTLKMDTPCYYYPADEFTGSKPYFLGSLGVSWNDKLAALGPTGIWQLQNAFDSPRTYSPSSASSCLLYGDSPRGTEQGSVAVLHRYDIPYSAHLTVMPEKGWERKYLVDYCLTRDEAGHARLLSAKYNERTGRYECQKRD